MGYLRKWDGECVQYEFPFFLSYCIFLLLMICRTTFFGQYISGMEYKGILCICLLLLFAKEYADGKFNPILIIAVFLIGILALIIHKDAAFTKAIFLVYLFCARDVSFERIAKVTVILSVFMLFLVIFCAEVGLITNYIMDPGSSREREFLGFLYALYPAAYLTNIISLEIYLKKEKIKLVELLFLFAVNYWIYVKTNSRLSFAMAAGVIGLGLLLKIVKKLGKHRSYSYNPLKWLAYAFSSLSFVICAAVSIWLQASYDPSVSWMWKLNNIFTGRLDNGKLSLMKYGFSMFGKQIEWVGNGLDVSGEKVAGDYLYVDCAYLQVLQHYGIFFFLFILLILTITVAVCCYYKKYVLVLLLLTIAVHMMIDDLILDLWYNTFWFVSAQVILNRRSVFPEKSQQTLSYESLGGETAG